MDTDFEKGAYFFQDGLMAMILRKYTSIQKEKRGYTYKTIDMGFGSRRELIRDLQREYGDVYEIKKRNGKKSVKKVSK